MGADLTALLAGGSLIFAGTSHHIPSEHAVTDYHLTGDIPTMTYSIGGADARTNSAGAIGGALGTETGLSGHLRFKECDSSGTRYAQEFP